MQPNFQNTHLEKANGSSHELTLLRLYALDLLNQSPTLPESVLKQEALEVRLDDLLTGGKPFHPKRLSWCSEVGVDRFGIFAKIELKGGLLRVRFVPSGTFWMGAPAEEGAQENDEGPRHQVRLTSGFGLMRCLVHRSYGKQSWRTIQASSKTRIALSNVLAS